MLMLTAINIIRFFLNVFICNIFEMHILKKKSYLFYFINKNLHAEMLLSKNH